MFMSMNEHIEFSFSQLQQQQFLMRFAARYSCKACMSPRTQFRLRVSSTGSCQRFAEQLASQCQLAETALLDVQPAEGPDRQAGSLGTSDGGRINALTTQACLPFNLETWLSDASRRFGRRTDTTWERSAMWQAITTCITCFVAENMYDRQKRTEVRLQAGPSNPHPIHAALQVSGFLTHVRHPRHECFETLNIANPSKRRASAPQANSWQWKSGRLYLKASSILSRISEPHTRCQPRPLEPWTPQALNPGPDCKS